MEGSPEMRESRNSINSLLDEMVRRGLASTSNHWIEMAIRDRNPRLSVGIASSKVLVYDKIDRRIMPLTGCN
jgi:hypothetical protein